MARRAKKKLRRIEKKESSNLNIILIVILAVVLLMAIFSVIYFSKPGEEKNEIVIYTAYKFECTQNNAYFESQSLNQYGKINQTYIFNLRANSADCNRDDVRVIDLDDLSDLGCHCLIPSDIKKCMEGYSVYAGRCYNETSMGYANFVIPCKVYNCNSGDVVEADYS